MPPNALTGIAVKNAKPSEKTQRLWDAGGLYLEVSPAGSKLWRLKYRYDGREKRLSFGKYPDVTLKDARATRAGSWLTMSTQASTRSGEGGEAGACGEQF